MQFTVSDLKVQLKKPAFAGFLVLQTQVLRTQIKLAKGFFNINPQRVLPPILVHLALCRQMYPFLQKSLDDLLQTHL